MNTIKDYIKDGWFPWLRDGLFQDSKGRWHCFDEQKLEKIEAINSDFQEAPLCIGHPKDNKPAKGLIDKIKKVGNVLLARPKKILADMVEKLKNGEYKFVSASINPKTLKLNHIGFVDDPAIKGLGQFPATAYANFSSPEGEDEILLSFEFSALHEEKKTKGIEVLLDLLSKIGLWGHEEDTEVNEVNFVADYGKKENTSGEPPEKEEQQLKDKDKEKDKNPPGNDNLQADVNDEPSEFEAKYKDEKKRADMEKERADASEAKLSEIQEKQKEDDAAEFAEKLINETLVYPKRKEEVQELFKVLVDAAPIEFSGEKDTKISDVLHTLLKEAQKPVPLDKLADLAGKGKDDEDMEFEAADVDPEEQELNRKVRAIMKEKKIGYEEALAQVRR